MTAPDYPLLSLGGYETYQLAHIATFIADSLARHRLSRRGPAGRDERAAALRDLALGRTALDAVHGTSEPTSSAQLPRPIDASTFESAIRLLGSGERHADVVALPEGGPRRWAVIGQVPGIGRVGAVVATADVAAGLRTHFLTRPVAELASWAVTDQAQKAPVLPEQVNLARAIERLDPRHPDHRVVAEALHGPDPYVNAAIRRHFPEAISQHSAVGDPERAGDERGPVGDEGVPVAQPDQHRREPHQHQDPHQALDQAAVAAQDQGDGGQQLHVAPAQSAGSQDGDGHGDDRDRGRTGHGSQAARPGDPGDQQRGAEQRDGQHVGQSTFTRVDRGDGGSGDRERQPHRYRPRPPRREQTAQPGCRDNGRGLDHPRRP